MGGSLTAASNADRITMRSSVTTSRIRGRCTFTATSPPHVSNSLASTPGALSRSLALYTCPMDAAATGASNAPTSSNTSSRSSPPNCALTSARASSLENGATWSRSSCSASRYAFGRRSGRIATACPTFTNAGPCDAMRSRSAAARLGAFRSTVSAPDARSPRNPASHVASFATSDDVRDSDVSGRALQYARIAGTSYVVGSPSGTPSARDVDDPVPVPVPVPVPAPATRA
eukprot:31151-Pelagococcus_subviridis.AAC.7